MPQQHRKPIATHIPCPKCDSSDAFVVYEDYNGKCFSCGEWTNGVDKEWLKEYNINIRKGNKDNLRIPYPTINAHKDTFMDNNDTHEYLFEFPNGFRGISRDTYKHYGVTLKSHKATKKPIEIFFPFLSSVDRSGKVRGYEEKKFRSVGDTSEHPLFGLDKFNPGGKSITITEGELDALSVYQMLGSKRAAVSVRGSSSARQDCITEFDYINSFSRIYIAFDSDEPGRKATTQVAQLFDPRKVYIVEFQKFKDANDYLVNKEQQAFVESWNNARRYVPKGVVSSYQDIKGILERKNKDILGEYPYATLQDMTYGIRPGEITLFTAQEKVGKTEVMRGIEHHLLKTTDHNIGIIHLEESEKRCIQGLVGLELGKPCHLPDADVNNDQILEEYKKLTKRDDRLYFYSHFGTDDKHVILNTIRFLAGACDCKVIFFDHITMAVTGAEEEDERKALDYISQQLAMMVRELDFSLQLVSHVNDEGKTRGSRNIAKVADIIVNLDREIDNPVEKMRNQTNITLRGNRPVGRTGPGGLLQFDPETFLLKEELIELAKAPF